MSTTLLMSWFGHSESRLSLSQRRPETSFLDSELIEKFALGLICYMNLDA